MAMTLPVDSLSALIRIIDALPPPAADRVRVYRGQTANYPAMLPSACRPNAPFTGRLWDIALLNVREAAGSADAAEDSTARSMATLMNLGVWFKVLAQHYGPGSPYLDVTTSPDVALWFALNENLSAGAFDRYVVTESGAGPIAVVCPTLKFAALASRTGWFYVLDVPRGNGTDLPKHGELLELAAGPPFVSGCLRVVRQHGGLVMGDRDVDGGDLSPFYAYPPIAVTRPFADCPFIDREPRFVFPGPDEDAWYARFLQAPLVPQPSADQGVEYRQSLGVYLVTTPSEENTASLLDRQVARMPPLVRARLRAMPETRQALRAACGADPEAATYVQVEVPLLAGLPPAARWNQSALAAGLARRVQPRVETSGEPLPAVSLENVLVQLSPLETSLLDAPSGADTLTAVWLVRRGLRVLFTAFMNSYDTGADDGGRIVGPLPIEFADDAQAFVTTLGDARVPLLDAALPEVLVKGFFVGLELLRGVSRTLKPDPYPAVIHDKAGRLVALLPMRTAPLALTRSRKDPQDLRLHFLRYARSLQPYVGPGLEMPSAGLLEIELSGPDEFQTLASLREVYARARELTMDGRRIALPARDTNPVSATVGAFLSDLFAEDPPPATVAPIEKGGMSAADEGAETAWLCDQFTGILDAESGPARRRYLFEHPALLSSSALGAIQRAIPKGPETTPLLMSIDEARRHLSEHPNDYPTGHGPLEHVIAALRSGEIDLAEAIALATTRPCSEQLSQTYLRAVMTSLLEQVDDDVGFAMEAAETAFAAAWAMPWPSLAVDVRRGAAEQFIRLVHRGLVRRPDGRLYARACEAGEWGVLDARHTGNLPLAGAYLHLLGAMSLDAYAANFAPSPAYRTSVASWLARATYPMPEPAAGLAQARVFLSAAVDLRPPGPHRGATLKALVETLVYEDFARDAAANRAEVSALADRAIADLDPQADEGAIARVGLLRSLVER